MAIARNLDKYNSKGKTWFMDAIIKSKDLKKKSIESDGAGGHRVIIGTLVVLLIALFVSLIAFSVTTLKGVFSTKTECEHALDVASADGTMGAVFDKCFVGGNIIVDEATGKVIREW